MKLYTVKHLKCLRTRKYNLEYKCEWNLSLVWLFLATVTFHLNCLDRVVLAHPFWALTTFPACFAVLSCWTNTAPPMGTKWSTSIYKNTSHVKKQYMCRIMIILCQWDCNEQMEKLVRLLLHHHHWLDSPCLVLAFFISFAHSSLSRATFFQFLTSNILVSWSTPSSHRNFGLPTLLNLLAPELFFYFSTPCI